MNIKNNDGWHIECTCRTKFRGDYTLPGGRWPMMLNEKCHSSDIVSRVSDEIISRIENEVNDFNREVGTFSVEAFDEIIYVTYEVIKYDTENISADVIDNMPASAKTNPIRIYVTLPFYNKHVYIKYKNVVEHEVMHAYWIHLKGGFLMTDEETERYKDIIKSTEAFSRDNDDIKPLASAIGRCLYFSFGAEKSAIIQSFDYIIRKMIDDKEPIDAKSIIEKTEAGMYLDILNTAVENYDVFKHAAPYVFNGDVERLGIRLRKLIDSLAGIINSIIKRRTEEYNEIHG